MKNNSMLKTYQNSIMDNGMAHIVYHQSSIDDVIHPFSVKGYEILSDEFVSFLEKYRVLIPKKVPIVLEFVGNHLEDEEKKKIDSAIWSHFCLIMSEADREVKKCLKRCAIFLLFTILSTVFIFALSSQTAELFFNLAYMPFYFFGYRLLTYILLDSMPMWKDRRWYRRLASMKLIFSEQKSRPLDGLDAKSLFEETISYEQIAENEMRQNKLIRDSVYFACNVQSIDDVIQVHEDEKRAYVSGSMSAFLDQSEPFLSAEKPIEFAICGKHFSDGQKKFIELAIKNYYGIKTATEEHNIKNNIHKISWFEFLVIASAILLIITKNILDVAAHEFVIMLLWFFGDYLLEFILLTQVDILKAKKKMENCHDMKILYEDKKI